MRNVSELCLLAVDCVNKTAPTVNYETPFKMIRTTNVKGGFIDLGDVRFVEERTFERWTRRSKPQIGDVILSREAPVGEVGRFTSDDGGVFLGQRLFHYRPDPNVLDWNYLAFVLQSHDVQGRLRSMGFGATVDHIRVPDAENLSIPCPPIEVQSRIGAVLSAYDDLIENNRRRMALLDEAARQLYREWFVRLRFPGHEHTRIVDSMPQRWERTTAHAAMDVLSGGTPKTTNPDYWDGDIPFYTPKDATDTCYVLETERSINELGLKNCNSRLYARDTVFISARGTVGKLNLASRAMAMSQSCYALVGRGHVLQLFLFCALREAVAHFKQNAAGAVFDAVVVDTFKLIPFVVPDEQQVVLFEEAVSPMFRQIANLAEQNQKLRAARGLLLPRLMNGEYTP